MQELGNTRCNGASWFLPIAALVNGRLAMPFRISLGDAQHALALWIIFPERGNLLIEVREFRNGFSPRAKDQRALLSAPFRRRNFQRGANICGHRVSMRIFRGREREAKSAEEMIVATMSVIAAVPKLQPELEERAFGCGPAIGPELHHHLRVLVASPRTEVRGPGSLIFPID